MEKMTKKLLVSKEQGFQTSFQLHFNQIILDNASLPENTDQRKKIQKTLIYINKKLTPDNR